MRKNIFQLLQEHFDLHKELDRIDDLFNTSLFMINATSLSAETIVDKYMFSDWKQRNRCVDIDDMREVLNIDDIPFMDNPSLDDTITYLEYVQNILCLARKYVKNHNGRFYADYTMLRENIESLLNDLNLETHYFDNEEMAIIVEKNGAVTAVAEILPNNLSLKIIKYNHFTLQGNIETKKDIILSLADKLEPKRKHLGSLNKQLTSNLFFMLNNLNLRHNNIEKNSKHYKNYVSSIRKSTLEKWYDEVYQLELLAFLLLDNEKRNKKIDDLKSKIEQT